MSFLYPYFLYVQKPPVNGNSQNSEGDFEESTSPEWFFIGNCRDEKNSGGKRIALTNGDNIQFDSVIYSNAKTPIILENSEVVVTKEKLNDSSVLNDSEFIKTERLTGLLRLKDKVKGSNQTRLNFRIWV